MVIYMWDVQMLKKEMWRDIKVHVFKKFKFSNRESISDCSNKVKSSIVSSFNIKKYQNVML